MTPKPEPELVDVEATTVLAAVGIAKDHGEIPGLITDLLDRAWAQIRGTNVEGTGHNVVIYRNQGTQLSAGVQVPDDTPEPPAPLILAGTPAGRAAHLRHIGPYAKIPDSIRRLFAWCAEQGHTPLEPTWEVYGDWQDDETQLVTDIYVVVTS